MTLQEILKANGVGDDSVAAILAAMKENKIFFCHFALLDKISRSEKKIYSLLLRPIDFLY